MNTLRVDVLAFDAPCERCGIEFWWVFGLLPSSAPASDEFTSTDFPDAVDVARAVLATLSGPDAANVAGQLHDRPAWQRGLSFNPNRCPSCGHQADWDTLYGVIIRAYHEGEIRAAEGRIPVAQWRTIRGKGQGIAWPLH